MNIVKVNTEKKSDRETFIRFPFELYRGSEFWVPPFPGEMEMVMNRQKHPFYSHSTADFFLAKNGDETLGRIAVLKNENYCRFHDQKVAFAYYLEIREDAQVASDLLAAAEAWAREHGADQLLIGKGLLRSNCAGIHVAGFDLPPAMGIAYQMPYFDKLIQSNGYAKETDYFSGILEHRIDPKVHEVAAKVKARNNFWIKSFKSTKEMEAWIPKVDRVHHEAFAHNPSFYPSTAEEFALLCSNIIAVAVPPYTKLIMHGDEIAGFILAYPNLNRALRATHGSGSLPSMLRLLYEKKHSRWIDMNGVGLLPKYQGLGGNALLYSEVEKVIAAAGMVHAEIIQVDERNFRSYSDMNTMGVEWKKTHRTYIKQI